ncbi:hypothetical protein [Streptomyces luteireticuli]|uniref:hypothetical protein n=1 Tax=Streptomyces luteireticuli TaxID=173858 RepID=UPI003556D148
MANTRQYDRIIETAARKLAAVENRELWALEGSERRAILAAGVVGSVQVTRGKSTGRADRTIETTWSGAAARLRSEISAAQAAKEKAGAEAAAAKVARRTERKWW